jgi:hypothetical protein
MTCNDFFDHGIIRPEIALMINPELSSARRLMMSGHHIITCMKENKPRRDIPSTQGK